MPNWCHTNIYFYGEESIVFDFYKKLNKWINAEESICENCFGVSWLGNIIGYTFGKNFVKEREYDTNLRFRGWIRSLDEPENFSVKKDTWFFTATMESAWYPHMKMWYLVIEKLYGKNANIHIAYHAKEPGMRLYCILDQDHIIYKTEKVYHIDAWDINDKSGLKKCSCEYEEDELIEIIKEFFNINCTENMLDDIDKLNETIREIIKESGQSENDCGFYIKKYKIVKTGNFNYYGGKVTLSNV